MATTAARRGPFARRSAEHLVKEAGSGDGLKRSVGLKIAILAGSEARLATRSRIGAGYSWAGDILSLGALIAITSVTLTVLNGQTRIMFAMSRDGLVPRWVGKLSTRRTPARITLAFGALVALLAAFVPLAEIAKLVNIGTLFAFLIVNVGVIILRRAQPDMDDRRGALHYLMSRLEAVTWLRFGGWLLVGLLIYFLYGRTHSVLQRGEEPSASDPAV